MSLAGFLFVAWRIFQVITLIPIVGMLAYFVHGYVNSNQLTPTYILVEFIASVLAAAWTIATLITYFRARHSALFVALVDLAFVGTFIAAVYLLRGISNADCANFSTGGFYFNLGVFGYYGKSSDSPWALNINKTCAMLKACFALGIIECIAFFVTFLLALLVHRHYRNEDRVVVKREYHTTRHHNRHSSRGSYDGRRSSPRRSHQSSSRRYYV
ncbi:hypothetical protein MBLNU459_g5900t1 [Dothideomycetes sp. NU459]